MEGRLNNCAKNLEVWSRDKRRNKKNEMDHPQVTMEVLRGENNEQAAGKFLEAQSDYNKLL